MHWLIVLAFVLQTLLTPAPILLASATTSDQDLRIASAPAPQTLFPNDLSQTTPLTSPQTLSDTLMVTPTVSLTPTYGLTPTVGVESAPTFTATLAVTPTVSNTLTTTPVITPTVTPTATLPMTPLATMTPIAPVTVTVTPTSTSVITPTATPTQTTPLITVITTPEELVTVTPTATIAVTPTATPPEPTPTPDVIAEISPDGGSVEAFGGKIKVRFPQGAADETLLVEVRRPKAETALPYSLSGRPFEIVAEKKNGQDQVHQFNKNLEIEVSYADLTLDGDPENLTLFYFDEKEQTWIPLPTDVNTQTQQLVGFSDHLTVFDINPTNWEAATLPTVKGFQVALYTGAGTYAYPIEVPPGPGGFQPSVQLSYNSQIVDSATNKTQASWVGMGWSLDTGYVERDMYNGTKTVGDDTFQLVLNGSSYRLLPGSDGRWHTDSESFLRIQYAGDPNTFANQANEWTVWDKEGNKYIFGTTDQSSTQNHRATYPIDNQQWTWHWSLRTATNIFGQSISYSYAYEGVSKTGCGTQLESFCDGNCNDVAVYPSQIDYPNGKYRVRFERVARSDYDNGWNTACGGVRFTRSLLSKIHVEHHNGVAWELVRRYDLSYGYGSSYIFPNLLWNAGGRTPTLISIQAFGTDGTSSLPATTFTYGDSMHLTKADNGYKGVVEYDYSLWAEVTEAKPEVQDQKNSRCDGSYYQWQANATTTKTCANTTPSGLRFKGSGATTYGNVWEDRFFQVFRPGGSYRFQSYFQQWDKLPHEVRVGLEYGGTTAWEGTAYHPITFGSGSNEDLVDVTLTLPATASRMWLQYEGNGVLRAFTPHHTLTRYRVSTKRIKDNATSQTHTFTYAYDEPATNDAAHSTAAALTVNPSTQKRFSDEYSEFRGHALVREEGPDGRVTLHWFRQSDERKGQEVYQHVGEELFNDEFDSFNGSAWAAPNGWTWVERMNGDNAYRVHNPNADWNITAYRSTDSMSDGKVALTQFKVSGGSTSAVLALEYGASRRWGIYVAADNSLVAQWNNGGGFFTSALLSAGQFKRDVWYVLMLGVDNGTDLVRVWERDSAPEGVAVSRYQSGQVSSGLNWHFRVWANAGSVYLDAYNELKLLSETESKYDASAIALQSGWTLTTVDNGTNKTLIGLAGYWTRPASAQTLTFNNDAKFVGTRAEYSYDMASQGNVQLGNMTHVIEKSWNGSGWDAYRATRRGFYPLDNTGQYLASLPGYENRYVCTGGVCDYSGDDITASTWFVYDGAIWYYTPPTAGKLTKQRALVCFANSSNVCVGYGGVGHARNLFSDVTFTYDGFGNRASQTSYSNYGYTNSSGTTNTDATGGQTTTFVYSDGGHNSYKTSETNAASHVMSWVYDYRLSVPTQETDPNSVVTTAEYDVLGRITKLIRPGDSSANPTLAMTYYNNGVNSTGPFGVRLQQRHSGGTLTLYKFYDGLGQRIQTVSYNATVNGASRDIIADTRYNAYGLVDKQTAPYDVSVWAGTAGTTPFRTQSFGASNTTVTAYDKFGRVTNVTPPTTAAALTYSYPNDLESKVVNGKSNSSITTKDVWGRVVEVRNYNSSSSLVDPWLRYSYDAADRLLSVQKVTGSGSGTVFATTSMTYDLAGRKLTMNDMDMGAWSYAYDGENQLTSQTDARGCITSLSYSSDALHRLTAKSYSGACGSGGSAVSYGYDAITSGNKGKGKRTSMSDGSGSTTWVYGDSRGRLTTENKTITGGGTFVTQWGYDSGDQVTSMTYPDGEVVNYTYLPQMLVDNVGGGAYASETRYDAAGRVELRKLGADQIRTDFIYNGWNTQGGRLQIVQSGAGSPYDSLQKFEYNYDNNGNVNWIKDYKAPAAGGAPQQQGFGYDALDRLVSAGMNNNGDNNGLYTQSYSYDSYGRLLNGPLGNNYSYGNSAHKHAVTAVGTNSYSYDANGNQTGRTVASGGYTLSYDAENRLSGVTGAATASFAYDGDGIRVKDEVDGSVTTYIGNYYEEQRLLCGGQTTPGSTNWQVYESNSIYLDINTSACGLTTTPFYLTTIGGSAGQWETVGATSIYNPTPTGFRVYVRYVDGRALTPATANSNQWHINWLAVARNVATSNLCSGQTSPGATNWQNATGGIVVTIDTSVCNWSAAPLYLTTLGGDSGHWFTTGATAIYYPTATGFSVYVRQADGAALTPATANANKWHINWVAIPKNLAATALCSGQTTPGSTSWGSATGGIVVNVSTAACGYGTAPLYFTSIGGNAGQWLTTGATAIYNPNSTSFNDYVRYWDGSTLTPAIANTNLWHINWMALQGGSFKQVRKYYYAGNQRIAERENGSPRWLLGDHLGSTAYTINGAAKTGEVRYLPFGANRYTNTTTD